MPEYRVEVGGRTYTVDVGRISDDSVTVTLDGRTYEVSIESPVRVSSKTPVVHRTREIHSAASAPDRTARPGSVAGGGEVMAPLPGVILKVLVSKGDEVAAGQPVAVMEAMKMENEVEAPRGGTVTAVHVKEGESVLENAPIVTIGD